MKYDLKSIGTIETGERGFVIQLEKDFRSALTGLENFSHIQVYWWAHLLDRPEMRKLTTVEKPYVKSPDQLGIFATRSPVRPNPLAMTLVPLTFIDLAEGMAGLAYIDAEPGTPVLDIKPYYGMERVREYTVPSWCAHWPEWYEDAADFDWESEFVNAR
ncbi:TrmO family methyltransferase domain-containing protein [Spirochaeta isovalerica]|uniref:tRNA (Thr-GGU) A37 N-methylase n=1 Tax=Spirochaeta isovalerica TaxID=150 RepID=A0A841RAU2_9SPIO|nr:TrmO family methyltransferase [Spirochaeta isovalerica]MBB6480039.1 tRNA (Thr-GGU) A37 N-methylase [Spirochaeta isovalerica]